MTIYAIGDVRGNIAPLRKLLDALSFDAATDTLWFTGDLVNTGDDSLAVLRFVKSLGKQAVAVLGYEEIRLLTIAEGLADSLPEDRFEEVLAASDREELLKWLRQRPLLHHEHGFTLVHAGIPGEWSLSQARTYAIEAETSLSMYRKAFLENIMANDPTRWHAKHRGWKRLRFIVNALTRISYCNDIGRCDFTAQGEPGSQPKGYLPWYLGDGRAMANHPMICGHRDIAVYGDLPTNVFALDSGCGVGGELSAISIATPERRVSVTCP